MKFLKSAVRRLTPRRFKTANETLHPSSTEISCKYNDEVLLHKTVFRSLEDRYKEHQLLVEENEMLHDFKMNYDKQRAVYPELKKDCTRACNKLNKILLKIWVNTRSWPGESDITQQLMKHCHSTVACRESIASTNQIIHEYMESIDFYSEKILQSEKKGQQLTSEFENEIQSLEMKLLDCNEQLFDDSTMIPRDRLIKLFSNLRWLSKTRYNKMVSASNQLDKVRSINTALKAQNWEERFTNARKVNFTLYKDLARSTSEIEVAEIIAQVVPLQNTLQRTRKALSILFSACEQTNVQEYQEAICSADSTSITYRIRRDEAEHIKAEIERRKVVLEGRVSDLDLTLRTSRGILDIVNEQCCLEREVK
jgi:hypothetical protein